MMVAKRALWPDERLVKVCVSLGTSFDPPHLESIENVVEYRKKEKCLKYTLIGHLQSPHAVSSYLDTKGM